MGEIIRRLINHAFYLFFWMLLGAALFVGVFYLIFSNIINFSDSWNVVHPSLPLINDAFFNGIISIIRSFESSLNITPYLSRILSKFSYGHGYAIVQAIGTLTVETIMALSGFLFLQTRHRERDVYDYIQAMTSSGQHSEEEAIEQTTNTRLNIRAEKRRYLTTFLVFFSLTLLIWIFDFYLTYAKQMIVSENPDKFPLVGPLGTILLMTIISVGFAFVTEEIRREILQIVGDVGEFFDRILGTSESEQLHATPVVQGTSSGLLPPPPTDEMVEVHSINGTLHIPLSEINEQWEQGEISINGRVYTEGDQPLSVSELFQVVNPPEGMPSQNYYTEEGVNSLESDQYEIGENRVIIFR